MKSVEPTLSRLITVNESEPTESRSYEQIILLTLRSHPRVIPGFGLSLGFVMLYLSIIVLLPLSALLLRSGSLGPSGFWKIIASEAAISAVRLSIVASLFAALLNVFFGLLVAWVLARYSFWGKKVVDAMIDLPFALPTAVAGIALTQLYSEKRWVGGILKKIGMEFPWPYWRGFAQSWWPVSVEWYDRISLTPIGVVMAMAFVGLPFVVRTVQPILEDLGKDVEEAAASLGAGRLRTFRMVILPQVLPALITGFALAFARGLGEYGSVIFIAGSRPDTQIAPQLIINMIEVNETGNLADATAVALLILIASFAILLGINLVQRLFAQRGEKL